MSINVNIFNFNSNPIRPDFFEGLNPSSLDGVNDILSDIFSNFAKLFDSVGNQFSGNQNIAPGGCVVPPSQGDCTHPQGSLKTDGNVITTPGGYKIEAIGQHEWKITGPDGKTTRVWGDPHVEEGDGGKWDFKRNSTFVLGDGTRINVTTAPWGDKGATVTQGLEVISGNDRVTVSGIDKGKGVVGQVTQDGYAHSNAFGGNDVFVMGNETDDWSYQGREITGSNNGGDSFKLGNQLAAGNTPRNNGNFDIAGQIRNFINDLMGSWNQSWRPNQIGSNPYYNGLTNRSDFRADDRYDRGRHQNQMREAFKLFGQLFKVLERLSSLSDRMYAMRNRSVYA